MAVAESLTGGLLSAALTASPGSSATFRGGLVVYATELKAMLAGVPQPLLDAQGAVSADVAAALAGGVRDRLGSDLGIGISGVAGPDPVGDYPAGTVFLAVSAHGIAEVSQLQLNGSRAEIRAQAVSAALRMLVSVITASGPAGARTGMPEGSSGVTP